MPSTVRYVNCDVFVYKASSNEKAEAMRELFGDTFCLSDPNVLLRTNVTRGHSFIVTVRGSLAEEVAAWFYENVTPIMEIA
jgi:hypothetical protein